MATTSLFNRMYDHELLTNHIRDLEAKIKELETEKGEEVQKLCELEQTFIDELNATGEKSAYFTFRENLVFCIYPKKIRIIKTRSAFDA